MKSLRTVLNTELAKRDMDQKDLAGPLGLSQQAVSDWAAKGKIPRKHWGYIRETLGFDPSVFTGTTPHPQTITSTANNGSNAAALNVAGNDGQVSISTTHRHGLSHGGDTITAQLSVKEYEALTLYRKYGNPTLLDECVDRLQRVREILSR